MVVDQRYHTLFENAPSEVIRTTYDCKKELYDPLADNSFIKFTSFHDSRLHSVILTEMPYTYKKLKKGEFRIANIMPGNQDVTIELLIETLESQNDDGEAYDALSWQWGSNRGNMSGNTIFIKDQNGEPHLMLVRPNLLWALKRLRQLTQNRRLWVDFICINQADPEERAEQVTKMTEIYSAAESVHVWLGKSGYAVHSGAQDDFTDAELEIAVQHIDTLYNLDDANHIGSVDIGMRNKADLHNLEPLFKLLKRGWFSRRWVVQVSHLIGSSGKCCC